MKRGLLAVNAFLNTEKFLSVYRFLQQAAERRGIALDIVGTRYFFFQLGVCVAAVIAIAALLATYFSALGLCDRMRVLEAADAQLTRYPRMKIGDDASMFWLGA